MAQINWTRLINDIFVSDKKFHLILSLKKSAFIEYLIINTNLLYLINVYYINR